MKPRSLLVIATVCAGALVITAAPASAEPFRSMTVAGYAACDAASAEWVITWTVTNEFDVAGTLGNVRVTPADRTVDGLPAIVEGGATVTGTQRIPAVESTASVTLDVNWQYGPVTYNVYRPSYIKASCR
jgi:hypothetical protein